MIGIIALTMQDRGVDLSEADMRLVLAHTKTIRDFLQKEIPALFE
jgi:hypothetical protein